MANVLRPWMPDQVRHDMVENQAAMLSIVVRLCSETQLGCHLDLFASFIPSEARNFSIYAQGKLRDRSDAKHRREFSEGS